MNHEKFLQAEFDIATLSRKRGNHPFGAVLVLDNKIVLKACNTVVTDKDVTKHAEFNLVSQASKLLTKEELSRSFLFSSTEPCVMCCGAIYWTGVRSIVYGCSGEKLGQLAGKSFAINCRDIFNTAIELTEVRGPLLETESLKPLKGFWDNHFF